ncbi:anti-sigma factor [Paenibacillus luteus]|uniref:anti-sigma factor n=1 Tax=Paenibacillus luteus TaxID=2545753 RepID=UPI001376247E|nr:anti-sigma factor [Paenibacillus luteus]
MRLSRKGICEDVEVYLLGGLDQEDKLEFEAHLPECEECRHMLEELSSVINVLPLTVEPVQPPSGMKARILAAVADADQEKHSEQNSQNAQKARSSSALIADGSKEAPTERKPAEFDYSESRVGKRMVNKPKGKRWLMPTIAAAAAVLLLVSAGLYQRVNHLNGEADTLAAQVQELQSQLAAIDQPPTGTQVNHVVALSPTIPDIVAQGLATIVIDDKGMHLIVQAENLPKLTKDEAFQVWLLKEGKPVNAGTFLTQEGTGALYYTFAPDEYDQIAITHEPDAKGLQPRGEIVLAGSLLPA